ncbi:MAG: hypothetical protein ACK55I_34545, partial [bacterium]
EETQSGGARDHGGGGWEGQGQDGSNPAVPALSTGGGWGRRRTIPCRNRPRRWPWRSCCRRPP